MTKGRITAISERDCTVNDTLDVAFPGVLDGSKELVQKASEVATRIMDGQLDPTLAAEMLLLAGLGVLRGTNKGEAMNAVVHFVNLTYGGEELPPQSVYVAMKPTQARAASPRTPTIITPAEEAVLLKKAIDTTDEQEIPFIDEGQEYAEAKAKLMAELEAQLPPEVKEAAAEFEASQGRLADKPSMADTPTPDLGEPSNATIKPAPQPAGLHGSFKD